MYTHTNHKASFFSSSFSLPSPLSLPFPRLSLYLSLLCHFLYHRYSIALCFVIPLPSVFSSTTLSRLSSTFLFAKKFFLFFSWKLWLDLLDSDRIRPIHKRLEISKISENKTVRVLPPVPRWNSPTFTSSDLLFTPTCNQDQIWPVLTFQIIMNRIKHYLFSRNPLINALGNILNVPFS